MRTFIPLVLSAALVSGCGESVGDDDVDLGGAMDVVYVTAAGEEDDAGDDLVHLFDRATLEPIGTWEVGDQPGDVHATPDGSLVWVLNGGSGTVSLLETGTGHVHSVAVGARPVHSYLSPARDAVWVGNDGSASVSVIDLLTHDDTVTTLVTGAGHHKMAFATDDTGELAFGYVSNITDGTITPVSAAHVVQPNVPDVGPAPHGMDYAASTTFVYNCSGDAQNSIEVIATRDDATTPSVNEQHTIVERIPLPARCGYLHVESDDYAFATLGSVDQIARLRLSDHVVETFDACDGPDKVEIVGDRAYVSCTEAPEVALVDLAGVAAPIAIAVGHAKEPASTDRAHRGLRLDGTLLFVPNAFDGTVSVIDTTTNTVVRTWTGLARPTNVAVAGVSGGTTYPR